MGLLIDFPHLPSQLAYEAWVAGSKAALKSHKREEIQLKREEKRAKKELCEEQSTVLQPHLFLHTFLK